MADPKKTKQRPERHDGKAESADPTATTNGRGNDAIRTADASANEAELIGHIQRLQAEFENYRKRTEKENERFRVQACNDLIEELLPLMDSLELAIRNARPDERNPFYQGIELVYAQFRGLLERYGVEEIPAEGRFDPQLHEAMLAEEAPGAERGSIIETLQRGYTQRGTVLRTAKVKVAK